MIEYLLFAFVLLIMSIEDATKMKVGTHWIIILWTIAVLSGSPIELGFIAIWFVWSIGYIAEWITKQEIIGEGDIMLLGAYIPIITMMSSWQFAIISIGLANLLVMCSSWLFKGDKVPYVPYLAIIFILSMLVFVPF